MTNKTKENKESERRNLYKILLCIYKFQKLEDFLFLKNLSFLKLCQVSQIHWNFNKDWLKKDFLTCKTEPNYPFQWACPLKCKNNHYGELLFFSSQKFSAKKKTFLKKITFFTASALYFIENKEKMKNVKQQWGGAFDSFSQAFCITDRNFKIIRANQSFQKITNKKELFSKNLFELFPIPVKTPDKDKQEDSWLAKGQKEGKTLCLEISFKPLFLRREKIQAFLFLIKDATKEIEIEEKLSAQAKERELGFIKGSIAHELNNPIAGIKLLLDIIEKRFPNREASLIDSLKEMQGAVDRCQQVIKQLLLVSQKSKQDRPSLSLDHKSL